MSQWTKETLVTEIERLRGREAADAARRLLDWGMTNMVLTWGNRTPNGAVTFGLEHDGHRPAMFALDGTGMVELYLSLLRKHPAFAAEERRAALRDRVAAVPNVALDRDALDRYPQFPVEILADDESFREFVAVADRFTGVIRGTNVE